MSKEKSAEKEALKSKEEQEPGKEQAHVVYEGERPAVLTTEPEKKKKKRYSNRTFRNVSKLEKGYSRAIKRTADAVSEGIDVWIGRRENSAQRRRNGAFKDFSKNSSKALRRTLKSAAEAPADILDGVARLKIGRRMF